MCSPTSSPPMLFVASPIQAPVAWVAVIAAIMLCVIRVLNEYQAFARQGGRKYLIMFDCLVYGIPILGMAVLFLVYIPWGDALQGWYNSQLETLVVVRSCSTTQLDVAYASAQHIEQILFPLGIAGVVSALPLSIIHLFALGKWQFQHP